MLTGTPPPLAAAHAGIPLESLLDAVDRYQTAGRTTLARDGADDWYQVNVEFADPNGAEHILVTDLAPALRYAEAAGLVTSWWYIRKTPYCRLRLRAGQHQCQQLHQFVTDVLDQLVARQLVATWTPSIYEPETWAFGGPEAMDIAHAFFHDDSTNILTYLHRADPASGPQPITLGRREVSLLVCTALLRAAGQDWHEQGDVWHRVAQMRPLDPALPIDQILRLAGKVHRLVALDTRHRATPTADQGPLGTIRPWLARAEGAGHALSELARTGALRRGIRDVLAHHVIFHWNRFGLTTAAQAVLAHAAATAILDTVSKEGDDGLRRHRIDNVART